MQSIVAALPVLFTEKIRIIPLLVESGRCSVSNIWDHTFKLPRNHLGGISLPMFCFLYFVNTEISPSKEANRNAAFHEWILPFVKCHDTEMVLALLVTDRSPPTKGHVSILQLVLKSYTYRTQEWHICMNYERKLRNSDVMCIGLGDDHYVEVTEVSCRHELPATRQLI